MDDRGVYPNRTHKVKVTESWSHFMRLCAKPWDTQATPFKQGEVPLLSYVTEMTVHLNSLLGPFVGLPFRPYRACTQLENVHVCITGHEVRQRERCLQVSLNRHGRENIVRVL